VNQDQRFISVLDNAGVGYFFIDKDGIIRDVNSAWVRLYKYGSADEVIGHHFTEIQRIEDLDLAKRMVRGILDDDPKYLQGEFSRRCKDGSIGYHTFSARTVLKDKAVIGIEGCIIDVTSRRQNEEKFRILFNNMSQGVALHQLVKDEEGVAINYRIVGVNPRFEEILGVHEEDIIGLLATEAYGVKDPPFFAEYLGVATTGNPYSFEVYFPPMNKYFIISVSRWEVDGFATIFTDITDRKHTEQALQDSEAKFRSLAQNSPYAIMIYQDDYWVYCNHAAERISGYSSEELYRQKFWEFVDDDYRDVVKRNGQRRQTGEPVLTSYEFLITTKNQQKKWVFINGNSTSFSGKPAGIISILDISDRKQMELDLRSAVEKAQESDRLKSAFLANMSHEIRTPMNAILGFSELIGEQDTTIQEQQKYTEIIKNAGKRLLHIINDIIDLSKLEAKQIEINLQPCNPYLLVNTTVESFRNMDFFRHKNGLRLEPELQDLSPELLIQADVVRLQQVLDNLITNAIKYTDSGIITVGASVKQEKGIDFLEFFIRDTGKGIPREKLSMVFERFRQVEENEFHEGAGLGLSICKAFVELMGGRIWLESEAGKGSTFFFTVPCTPAEMELSPALITEGNRKHNLLGITILIAEDEEDSYGYLAQSLKGTNVTLLRAESGLILMEMLENRLPDILLLDINMPGKTGYECLKEIRARGYKLKVIVQTAYAMADERKRCMEYGCDKYLAKPFDKKALLDCIADLIG